MANFSPVLSQHFFPNSMRSNTVSAKPLHTEIVDEALVYCRLHLGSYLCIRNISRDKAKSYRESVPVKLTQIYWMVDALKAAYFNFGIPVFGTSLSNHVFSIASVNSASLRCYTSFVLIASN